MAGSAEDGGIIRPIGRRSTMGAGAGRCSTPPSAAVTPEFTFTAEGFAPVGPPRRKSRDQNEGGLLCSDAVGGCACVEAAPPAPEMPPLLLTEWRGESGGGIGKAAGGGT